jgi:SAM-dependent MidA family methyltransferase
MANLDRVRAAALERLFAGTPGHVSWEAFMNAALYETTCGYYTRHVRDVGRHGDFSTSATLDSALARALVAWSRECRRGDVWRVVELGGGGGSLAREFVKSAGWRLWGRLTYHIVEVGRDLKVTQRQRLRWPRLRRVVHWHESVERALAACEYRAAMFGNEFIDAFPCVALKNDPSRGWRELHVCRSGSGLVLRWLDLTERGQQALAYSTVADLPVGSCGEVHLAFREWLAAIPSQSFSGRLLFIDYATLAPANRTQPRALSLRGYFAQQRVAGPELLHRFARQDLTADVHFADVRLWAEEFGWSVKSICRQAEFIRRWAGHAPSRLASSDDAGGVFWVIELQGGSDGAYHGGA